MRNQPQGEYCCCQFVEHMWTLFNLTRICASALQRLWKLKEKSAAVFGRLKLDIKVEREKLEPYLASTINRCT